MTATLWTILWAFVAERVTMQLTGQLDAFARDPTPAIRCASRPRP